MKTFALTLTLLMILSGQVKSSSSLRVQDTQKGSPVAGGCPSIVIECPATWTSVGKEDTYIMSVKVEGVESDQTLTYCWTISGGEIKSGQGTSTLTVRLPDLHKQTFTATIEVGGLPKDCNNKASCTVIV
jgi:hypothetical protein